MDEKYDFLINGAGIIGSSCALALARKGFCVGLLEVDLPNGILSEKPYLRCSALSPLSVKFLEKIDAWKNVERMRAFKRLVCKESEEVEFSAKNVRIAYLGVMVENEIVRRAIWQEFKKYPNLKVIKNHNIGSIEYDLTGLIVEIDDRRVLTKVLIGCEGKSSRVRELARIKVSRKNYDQGCILITIRREKTKDLDLTWQRFRPEGAIALLPLFDAYDCLVWYDYPDRIKELEGSGDLKERCEELFNLKGIEVIESRSFELERIQAYEYVKPNLAIIGDAAHSVHPLAGQGLNLGIKNLLIFLSVISRASDMEQNLGSLVVLKQYERQRMAANQFTQNLIDTIHLSFHNEMRILEILRNNFMLISSAKLIKGMILRYASGDL